MKIIQNTLKIQKKISYVSKKIWVGPKKVGSVGFSETRHFFGGLTDFNFLYVYSSFKKLLLILIQTMFFPIVSI